MKQILKPISCFLASYKYSLILFVFLNLIVYFQLQFYIPHHFLNIVCVFSLVYLLAKVKFVYAIIPNIILIFFLSFDCYFGVVYGNPLTLNVFASILETNTTEVQGVLTIKNVMIAIAIFSIVSFLVFSSEKELKKYKLPLRYPILTIILYFFLFIPYLVYSKIDNGFSSSEFKTNPYLTSLSILRLKTPIIFSDILTVVNYYVELNRIKAFKNTPRQIPEGIAYDENKNKPEKIYFILGETGLRDNYSLYGYPVKTTPFLDSLFVADKPQTHKYEAISGAALTRDAIRLCLTFATPQNLDLFYKYKSVIEMANDANYDTYWISNQFVADTFDNYTTLIANQAKVNYFHPKIYTKHEDLDLIPVLRSHHKTNKQQLFLLHLMGSHLPYEYNSDEIDIKAIPGNSIDDLYNQSVHHTDRVLREVYNIAKHDSSFIIYYIPDHGEIIGIGHGFMGKGSKQFNIPMVVITSSSIDADTIISKYVNTNTGIINSQSTPYIMSEILGFNVAEKNIPHIVNDGNYILHSDSQDYLYSDIQKEDEN